MSNRPNKRYLTKSRFKLAVECPTKLFYTGKPEYANTNNEDAFLAMLADGGFQVGELAKFMYPDGVEVTAKGVDDAIAETAERLKQHTVTLFEPAIVYEGFLVRVDVLVKRGTCSKSLRSRPSRTPVMSVRWWVPAVVSNPTIWRTFKTWPFRNTW